MPSPRIPSASFGWAATMGWSSSTPLRPNSPAGPPTEFKTGIGRVMDILRDTKDTLWVAGDGAGLFKALPRQHRDDPIQLDHFAHDSKDAGSLSRNGLQCVFEDASGMLWVSAYQGGLNKVVLNPASQADRERPSVFQYRNNVADPSSLSGDTISAIGEDRFGNLWVGTDGFGLNRLVAPTSPGQPAHFEHFRNDPAHAPGSLQTDVILTTHLDSQKQLWLGSYMGGLIRVDQTSATARPTFTHFRHDPQDPRSLHSDFIRDIVDDGAGRILDCVRCRRRVGSLRSPDREGETLRCRRGTACAEERKSDAHREGPLRHAVDRHAAGSASLQSSHRGVPRLRAGAARCTQRQLHQHHLPGALGRSMDRHQERQPQSHRDSTVGRPRRLASPPTGRQRGFPMAPS